MPETIERDPVMTPTVVRRVHEGAIETMNRRTAGQEALCVFWSVEHAQRDMNANGFPADEGWEPIERDHVEMDLLLSLLNAAVGLGLVYLEPAPSAPDLEGVFESDAFVNMLKESERV